MKNFMLIIASILTSLLLFACSSDEEVDSETKAQTEIQKTEQEQTKIETASFTVNGSCGMCKDRIEKIAKSSSGVKIAEWSQAAQTLTIEYTGSTDIEALQQSIANAGHDTELFAADDDVYNDLPACCHYRN